MNSAVRYGEATRVRPGGGVKVTNGPSGAVEPSDDVCAFADAPASFTPDVWLKFNFLKNK